MKGRAKAPGSATVVNAIATLNGGAFCVDLYTEAEVEVYGEKIEGYIEDVDTDSSLIERSMELTLDHFGVEKGGKISTRTEIPPASGLGSGSAAANSAVLATLDAIGETLDPIDAVRIGVEAARDVGATITGAFDDAAASMLGGLVLTDNRSDKLISREEIYWDVAIFIPDFKAKSSEVDVERTRYMSSMVDKAFTLAREGEYFDAITLNGLVYCATLGFNPSPAVDALKYSECAGLSGTGPCFIVVGKEKNIDKVVDMWSEKGRTIKVRTDNKGAKIDGKK